MDVSKFRKKTLKRIHIIKNHSIWISIGREINERNLGKKFDREERENIKFL